ncbi:unnamed protein product [Bursaphelenchus okinawaensis]|uniref:AI-2E family transporter n=1 Tax=Bursaphelenchus okinawaensis TaxID=465554 RepID=A0A811KCA0_9BILA|nr:unnamed protein product [Bursaphelenchus okinawaensis]CAG9100802.1 unnamed protein product [Bursaphelenchus okinawaensis]
MASQAFWNRLTEDTDQFPVKLSLYNTLFLALLGICLSGLYALFQMLHMFLTPILWAILVGTVLFPLKRTVSNIFGGWLNRLDEQNTPFLLGVVLLPLNAFNWAADTVYSAAFSPNGYYYLGAYVLIKILSYGGTFVWILGAVGSTYSFCDEILAFLNQNSVRMLVSVCGVTYAAWIFVQDYESLHKKKKFARSLSLPIWIVVLAYCADFCGPLRVLVFACSGVALGLISAGLIGKIHLHDNGDKIAEKVEESIEKEDEARDEEFKEEIYESEKQKIERKLEEAREVEDSRVDHLISSDTHLRVITALCGLLFAARHDWVVIVLIVLMVLGMLKNGAERTGATDSVKQTVMGIYGRFKDNINKLVNIVVAGSLRQFVHILFTSDKYLIGGLKAKVELISSIVVMIILAFSLFFFVIFTVFQVHAETVHLARLTTNVVSSNPEWLRTALNYTDRQITENNIDDYIQEGFLQGRLWLASNIRKLADPKDTKRADELEEQAKLIVDNLYRMWEERQVPNATDGQVISRPDLITQLMSASNLESLKQELTAIIKGNIETVLSIAQSVWTVVLLNVSLLSNVFVSVFGLILNFGFELLNFFIEIIVFLTAVYYLLASSTDQWLPLHWISKATPKLQGQNGQLNIAKAIESAISGVFVLSAKMAIFYGLYTYFVHMLFGLNIVFVPSLVAAMFAAVPIVPPYIVAVFGLIELYLVRGEGAATVFFAAASVAPLMFADTAFYREVKSSHPYVTGLAIIGGITWIGLEGAVIGPIILCCFLILIEVFVEYANKK